MAKGLLLGNGINAFLGIEGLSVACIGKRFRKNVVKYSVIMQNLFGVQIGEEFWECLENQQSCELGIEILAGILYKYVKENKKGMWSDNDEYRIQDVIACICISSIFFTEDGKINSSFDNSKMPSLTRYNYIYTLNYIEFWDGEQACIHLHGKVDLSKFCDEKSAVLVSSGRMKLEGYVKAVEQIKKSNSVIQFSPNEIIFAPESVEKNRLVCVTGIFPSDKLYPADDLFLYKRKELYTELDKVDELEIFGMSPYGDVSLIDKINQKKHVRVYIYKKKENEETKIWEKKLTCRYELLDSTEMR